MAVLNEVGKQVGARRFSHSPEGLSELKQFLLSFTPRLEELACILETNHGLLIAFLLSAGIPVYPVNPKTINGLRKVAGAKTDRIDAQLLAKAGYFNLSHLHRLEPDSEAVQELKTLTRDQDTLVQMQTRLVNQLTACLKEYYPAALHLFCKLQQFCTLRFLQAYPTPEDARRASVEEITALLHAGKFPQPAQAALSMVEELHRPQLLANPATVHAKSRLMLSLSKQLLGVLEDLASYDKAIRTLFLSHADHELWSSLPRAGKHLAPRLLAEWGDDRTRSANANSIQTLTGTAPVPFQSGNYAKAHKRFACVKPWRNDLYQFAWQSTRSEPWAATYYQRKLDEGKTRSMALRALANIWVRIMYRMWMTRTCYQAHTFEAAQLSHTRRIA